MIRRPPRSTRTDTLFPSRRSSDLQRPEAERRNDATCQQGLFGHHDAPMTNTNPPGPATAEPAAPPPVPDSVPKPPAPRPPEIGREPVCTPVTNAHLVCRLLLETKHKHNP